MGQAYKHGGRCVLSLGTARKLARVGNLLRPSRPITNARLPAPRGRPRVLIAGIYVGSKPNLADHIVAELSQARFVDVEQRWVCMRGAPPSDRVADVTVERLAEYEPKWPTLERIIGGDAAERFDYVLFFDDDIYIGQGFLDGFIAVQQACDFALAQPSRTWRSLSDWPITRRRLFHTARETRFVEIGPVTSMDRRFLRLALPFSLESPMGWGYDLAWPETAREHGLRLGIVDAVRVDHSFRPRSALYSDTKEHDLMDAFLASRPHVDRAETVKVLRRYFMFPKAVSGPFAA